MKNVSSIMKRIASLILGLMLVMILALPMETLAASSYVKSMTVSATSVSVQATRTKSVTATVTVAGSASTYVTAASSNTAVATVTVGRPSSGKTKVTIKGVKKGTAYVTVKTKGKNSSGSVIAKKIKVTVGYAPVSTLSLNATSKTLYVTKTFTVKPTVAPSTALSSVTYSSSNEAVATVSSTGLVKAIKPGTAYISVKTKGKTLAGEYLVKKCKVVVKYGTITSFTLKNTSLSVPRGSTVTIGKTILPAYADQRVKYTSSDTSVATVSSSGAVKGIKSGIVTITATAVGDTDGCSSIQSCKVMVVAPATGFTASDYSVTYGTKETYIEFKVKSGEEAELKALGFTVTGGIASKTCICKTAKYEFNKLPGTLAELKKIKLDNEFAPMAASIAALASYEEMNISEAMYSHPIFEMFDYLNGKSVISNADKSGVYYSMKSTMATGNGNGKYAYFDGAKPSNGYTPNKPYTFTLIQGPYYIPEKETINGTRPETNMILISFAGDDSQRYLDVYQSSDGNWYSWDDNWKHLVATIKTASTVW